MSVFVCEGECGQAIDGDEVICHEHKDGLICDDCYNDEVAKLESEMGGVGETRLSKGIR